MTHSNLTGLAQELVALVGLDAAMALINEFPGVAIEVPRGRRESPMRRRLVGVMGFDPAELFIQRYGGTVFRVPMCKAAMRDERDRAIIALVDAGMPVWKVAIEKGLHERTVWLILKRSPGAAVEGLGKRAVVPDTQLDLFNNDARINLP